MCKGPVKPVGMAPTSRCKKASLVSRESWTRYVGDKVGAGRRGQAMQVLDHIRDSAFILIVWENCQGRQEPFVS